MNGATLETAPAETSAKARETFDRCYYLGDYEDNGYHDSYFYVVYWDDRIGETVNKMSGATAFAGGWNYSADLQREIPADVKERIHAYLNARALAAMTAAELSRVMTPEPKQMEFGTRVRILKDSRKGCKTPYRAGDVGEISGHYWFGTFYKNGYNQQTRANGRAGVRLSDGRIVYCAMTLIRLDCEPDFERVKREAPGSRIACPHAWWSNSNPEFAG